MHCVWCAIPTWAAYNSVVSLKTLPKTKVVVFPLVPAPAHEWSTLLTVLKQTQHINTIVLGPNRKTVITLDVQLYEKAKQLEMSCNESNSWILRIGEMHTVMAALRTAGTSIENNGLDDAWIEAGLYGPLTTRQILEGKHLKQALNAHLTTIQALFDLYLEGSFQEEEALKKAFESDIAAINTTFSENKMELLQGLHQDFVQKSNSNYHLENLEEYDKKHSCIPTFKVIKSYIQMIMLIFQLICASREGN